MFALASGPPVDEPDARVERIGRFEVVDILGRGAMGTVYRARDPELDRVVAIKVRAGTSSFDAAQEDRLRREAQALARLTHPNVVTVYEAGSHDGMPFVAMECVEGTTLQGWLAESRSQRAVIDVLVQAGHGIAAAHAAGLVHRDVKPANVFVADNGEVKVGDFGLVRLEPGDAPIGSDLTLTTTGSLLGTPAYMAPEQLRGAPATEASDQFSYCVMLYEALFGARPFAGSTLDELRAAMARPLEVPGRAPRPVRRVLARGLAIDPAHRFATMSDLLAALTRAPRLRIALAAAAGAIVLAGGTAAVTMAGTSRSADPCAGADARFAGVWDDVTRAQVSAVFAATKLPYAADALRSVEGGLDAFRAKWTTSYAATCKATNANTLDPRMWCLEDRLHEARSLSTALTTADAKVVARASQAVERLPDVSLCEDTRTLAETVPPRDLAQKARVDGLRAELTKGRTAEMLGRYAEALATFSTVVAAAKGEGYAPLEAEALLEHARVQFATDGDGKGAEQRLLAALWAADRARHDRIRARAWVILAFMQGNMLAKFDESERSHAHAAAAIARLAQGREKLEAQMLGNRGQLLSMQGKLVEAEQVLSRAHTLLAEHVGDEHTETARALVALADVARFAGDIEKSIQLAERAYAIHVKVHGESHPESAKTLFSIGVALEDAGKYDEGAARIEQVLRTLEAALGADHIDLATATDELGIIRRKQGKLEEALALHRRAVELRETGLGREHPETAISLDNLGLALTMIGRAAEAVPLHERSLAATSAAFGEDSAETASVIGYLANALHALRRYEEALAMHRRSLAINEKLLGPKHHGLSYPLSGIGHVLLDMNRAREAIAPLERALALRGPDADPSATQEIRVALERARRGGRS